VVVRSTVVPSLLQRDYITKEFIVRQRGPPDTEGEPEPTNLSFTPTTTSFGMLLCVLSRISDMQDLGDR
jgi:hypothetical protein